MKRNTLVLLFLCTTIIAVADEKKKVEITANQSQPVEVELNSNSKFYVSATKLVNTTEVTISVEVENMDDVHPLFIFGHAFTEKDLKSQKPSIRFDKKSYGSTSRDLRICKSVDCDPVVQITSQQKGVFTFSGYVGGITPIELPMYMAKYPQKKNLSKGKYLIMQREIIYLDVEVKDEEKDETDDFDQLNDAYENLISELEEQTFCKNSKHAPSLLEQEQPYKDKIDDLKDAIADIKSANNWREREPKYKQYKELLEKLNAIDFKQYEKDCGGHIQIVHSHSCSYDSWTPNQVLSSLVRIYQNLDNGKVKKSSAVESAKALQRAWTNKDCPLSRKMSNAGNTKSQAEGYYDSIITY